LQQLFDSVSSIARIASRLFDGAAGEDFYGRLVDTLTGPGGYRLQQAGSLPPTLYRFVYDWRRDNVENA